MIQLGSLVYSQRNNLGVGKVVDISDTQATVEYFYSVSQRIPETFLLDTLTKTKLQRQTRCYIWLETQAIWIIGRVSEWDEEIQKYQIHLPDKKVIFVSEAEIYQIAVIPLPQRFLGRGCKAVKNETPSAQN